MTSPHLEAHLKIRPAPKPEPEENKKAREDYLNDLKRRLVAVHQFEKSEGWAEFKKDLENEEFSLLNLIEKSQDPTSLAKLTGTLLAVKRFANWPTFMSRELEAAAQMQVKEPEATDY